MPRKSGWKRANLRDVAREAGVSVATVSRVLNKPDSVSRPTRERVNAVIERLRFRRNPAARAINSGRTRLVGALIPTVDNAIFARFLEGLESELAERGLSIIVATTNEDPEVEARKATELLNLGAEGFIVSGVTHSAALERLVEWERLPIVAISCFEPGYHLPTVGYDNAEAARMALQHLYDLGHRRIAVIHGHTTHNDRTRTRIAALTASELPTDLEFFEFGISVGDGSAAARRVLDAGTDFTACLCLSDVLAMGLMFELKRRGLSVPGDMSVSGMEDLPISEHLFPSLTTIRLPVFDMGSASARALARWVNEKIQPVPQKLPIDLVHRQSTTGLDDQRLRMSEPKVPSVQAAIAASEDSGSKVP
ncbi:MAG: LacI family DNA-binding transcriptional regulator [Pseudomonadota bacterium]